jgi:hypothetical protein
MKPRKELMVSALVLACAAVGCQPVKSSDVRTSGLHADITAGSASGSCLVEVLLQVGGKLSNTYAVLTGDDRLVVYYAGTSMAMDRKDDIPGQARYIARMNLQPTDTELRVAFERGPQDVTAPNSTVLTAPKLNYSPLATTPYSRAGDALTVSWSPVESTDKVEYRVSGQCLELTDVGPAADPGGFSLPAGSLHKGKPSTDPSQQGITVPDNCSASVIVNKKRSGQVDPAFAGGSFQFYQEDILTFQSVP